MWSYGCCQSLLLSDSRHAHVAGSEAAPLSCLFPPFTAAHFHTLGRSMCACVRAFQVAAHAWGSYFAYPLCLRCRPASVLLNQTFLLSTISLLLTLCVLEAACPLQMKLISVLSPPHAAFPPAAAGGLLWKWQKTEACSPLIWKMQELFCVKTLCWWINPIICLAFSQPLESHREPEVWLLGSIIPPRALTDMRVTGVWNEKWQ